MNQVWEWLLKSFRRRTPGVFPSYTLSFAFVPMYSNKEANNEMQQGVTVLKIENLIPGQTQVRKLISWVMIPYSAASKHDLVQPVQSLLQFICQQRQIYKMAKLILSFFLLYYAGMIQA